MDIGTEKPGGRTVHLSDFYRLFCLHLGVEKRLLKRALVQLEKEGAIRINWHSPSGAHFTVRPSGRRPGSQGRSF